MCRAKSHLQVFCSGYGGRGALDSIPARQLSAGYSARTGYWCVQVTVFFYVRQLCVRAVEYRQLIGVFELLFFYVGQLCVRAVE